MSANRQQEIQNAQRQIASFEEQKSQLTQRLASTPANLKAQVQNAINQINQRIAGARTALQRISQAVDLVRQIPGGQQALDQAGARVGSAIDKFLEKYANYKGEIVRTPSFSLSFPTPIAVVQVSGSANIVLSAELSTRRTGATISGTAKLAGSINGSLGITVGFSLPAVGGLTVGGGITFAASALGTANITLSASRENLQASITPATVDVQASAGLYVDLPSNAAVKFALGRVKDTLAGYGISINNTRLTYPLGNIKLLQITTPTYSLIFNINAARFETSRSGNGYSCRVHPQLVAKFNALKNALKF